VITENAGKSAADLSGTHIGATLPRRRGRSVPDLQNGTPPLPARWREAVPMKAVGDQPPAQKKVDCGELFRSWAFPTS
jgi:hypothetical protein